MNGDVMGQQLLDLVHHAIWTTCTCNPNSTAPVPHAPLASPAPLAAPGPPPSPRYDPLRSQRDQTATRDRLRAGQISPERRIDLGKKKGNSCSCWLNVSPS